MDKRLFSLIAALFFSISAAVPALAAVGSDGKTLQRSDSITRASGKSLREISAYNMSAGEKAFSSKNYESAKDFFAKASELDPAQIKPRFMMGLAMSAMNDHGAALRQFQEILTRQPNNIPARVQLVNSMMNLKLYGEAQKQLDWILLVQPEHAEAKKLSKICSKLTDNIAEANPDGFIPLPVREIRTEESSNATSEAKGNLLPPPVRTITGWRVSDLISYSDESFGLSLEYAKFCMERDDLKSADKYLAKAELLAEKNRNTKRYLEIQVLRSLLNLYQENIRGFGQQLMRIKPMLTEQTYDSFLDIYNKLTAASSSYDIQRITGGVAMGAEHFGVAARIFSGINRVFPKDLLSARMLAEAQLENRDYASAEKTFVCLAREFPDDPEAYINLARFYLIARFNPEAARRNIEWAAGINPGDARLGLLMAISDCAEGKIQMGLDQLKNLENCVSDQGYKEICKRMITSIELHSNRNMTSDEFARVLALPGSSHGTRESLILLGENYLARGSFFLAMRCFVDARDLSEVGRAYLALSSRLCAMGEMNASAVASGLGLNALEEELRTNPGSSKAGLYLALFHLERDEPQLAHRFASAALKNNPSQENKRRLAMIIARLQN